MRVLYVDDDADLRELVAISLSRDPGLDVRIADSGQAAINMLAAGDWTPDLFLLDVMMPVMDGPTLIGKLRENPEYIPIPFAFFTARVMNEERQALLATGAAGLIQKPFDPIALADQVRALAPA